VVETSDGRFEALQALHQVGTNSRAELAAVSLGLRAAKRSCGTASGGTILIRPDSQ